MNIRVHAPRLPALSVALVLLVLVAFAAAAAGWLTFAPASQVGGLAASKCGACGVVESVRSIEFAGPRSGLSTMAGGSGFPGFRLGAGPDGALLMLLGAVTMGTAQPAPRSIHEVTVRLEDGSERVFRDARAHEWKLGDRVRVIAGSLRRQPG